jgi:hypothetical protein
VSVFDGIRMLCLSVDCNLFPQMLRRGVAFFNLFSLYLYKEGRGLLVCYAGAIQEMHVWTDIYREVITVLMFLF